MKKISLHIVFILLSIVGYGQTVAIPDPIFLNFLKTNYPQTINSSDELIISAAAQVTSTLSCDNLDIVNLEGIQYFTQLKKINAINNKLVSLPSLLPMVNLETLHLYGNKISVAPDFRGILNLKTVLLYDNALTQMPLFGNNPIIEEIIISKNVITSTTSLDGVPSLLKLDIGQNQLTQLPDLSLNVQLEELICWSNQLTTLPSLTHQINLRRLNAGKNRLTQTPDLSSNTQLSILALDNNLLTTIPDITSFTNLTSVKLHNNYFTFEDLLPYVSKSNFLSDYIYTPMLPIGGDTIDAYYNESVQVHSHIDTAVLNVTYDWFEGATALASSGNDEVYVLQTPGIGVTNRYVYAKLTHPSLPSLILVSDSILVRFNPCPISSNITYTAEKRDCGNSGTVQVLVSGYVSNEVNYILTSESFNSSMYSGSNKFTGLIDDAYTLHIDFSSTCMLDYNQSIKMPVVDCNEAFITPNNDGDMDTYIFPGKGTVIIYDKYGKEVKRANLPFEWDGSTTNGLVQPGYYIGVMNGGKERVNISVLY